MHVLWSTYIKQNMITTWIKIAVYLFPPSDCYVEKDISKTKETSREYPEEQTEMNISMFEHINLLY